MPANEADARRFDTAMLAHDIRSALQGVVGGVAVMEHLTSDPTLREQIDRISAAALSLSGFVQRMLDDSRDGNGATPKDGFVVADFANALRRRWLGEAREKGLGFELEVDAGLPERLDISRFGLNRVLGNLIANAIGHTDTGSVRVTFGRGADGSASFSVSDEGSGLSEAVIERVFRGEELPSLDPDALHGLGLHVVRRVSESIGGRIDFGTSARGGVEAVVRFPATGRMDVIPAAVTPAPAAAAETKPGRASEGPRVDLKGARILLAEDNPTNQMVANQMLRALNAKVTITSDGVEAMEAFEIAEFDLIVVDIEMPRMSGLDVIRAIRGRTDGREVTPIVALTAYALREHRERISAAGADGLISKPITSIDALGRALATYVTVPATTTGISGGPALQMDEAEQPVIDMTVYDALCEAIGGEMMDELLEKVVGDLDAAGADLSRALEPLDTGSIRSASHILISVAGAIGATRLQNRARALNNAAHAGASDGVAVQVRDCLGELEAATRFARGRRKAA
jgi:CheY-like chemotaxis protein/HPt (histidine-containing phosphotransfer) domain-containing protein